MDKIKQVLQSRKFWALIASLVTVGFAAYNGAITPQDAVTAAVGALAAYSIGTGLDNPAPAK